MRVAVTGGTGFLGCALVRRLLGNGDRVRVLARPSARADAVEAQGAEVVRGDLSDSQAIDRTVAQAEVVYHVAAKIKGPGPKRDFFVANVAGTKNVLEAALRARVRRVVYLSSIAVYGLAREGEQINEETPYDDAPEHRDLYGQSKIAGDAAAVSFAKASGLPVTILRPGVVYGPGNPLPLGLLGFRAGRTNFVFGNRSNRVPLNYMENLIDAMQMVAAAKGATLETFVIVDDDSLTLEQYHAAKSNLDGTKTIFLPGWPVLLGGPLGGLSRHQAKRALQDRWYDTRKIRAAGWKPRVGLREAIEQTLKASRDGAPAAAAARRD